MLLADSRSPACSELPSLLWMTDPALTQGAGRSADSRAGSGVRVSCRFRVQGPSWHLLGGDRRKADVSCHPPCLHAGVISQGQPAIEVLPGFTRPWSQPPVAAAGEPQSSGFPGELSSSQKGRNLRGRKCPPSSGITQVRSGQDGALGTGRARTRLPHLPGSRWVRQIRVRILLGLFRAHFPSWRRSVGFPRMTRRHGALGAQAHGTEQSPPPTCPLPAERMLGAEVRVVPPPASAPGGHLVPVSLKSNALQAGLVLR